MNAEIETSEQITLYYRQGSSDKVYQVAIEPCGELFTVSFAYGRRGATLTTGTKTSSPVDFQRAKCFLAKLVQEKKAKGYTEGQEGAAYAHADPVFSGILPQLLNPIEEAHVERFLGDDAYCAQEKFDGRHLLIRKREDQVEGINKKGRLVGLPVALAQEARRLSGNYICDGESVGEQYHAFDLLEWNGQDLRPTPYRLRLTRLVQLLSPSTRSQIKLIETAFSAREKTEMWLGLRRENREGIVLKQFEAAYDSGRPNQGGPQLKFKFLATLSAIVSKINDRRSVEISLCHEGRRVSCGNVAIPANHDIPNIGVIVEVRYLYAFRESRALHQPVYLGQRVDVDVDECQLAQLKYKAEMEMA